MKSSGLKIARSDLLDQKLRILKRPLVFTNGCFDILHRGHIAYLEQARTLGRSLVIGVNSDASLRKLGKGHGRPINQLEDRMVVLAALGSVDLVVPFDEDTPLQLITKVRPDFLVKGGDWRVEDIVGADQVREWGGKVQSIPIEFERSTSSIIDRIRS